MSCYRCGGLRTLACARCSGTGTKTREPVSRVHVGTACSDCRGSGEVPCDDCSNGPAQEDDPETWAFVLTDTTVLRFNGLTWEGRGQSYRDLDGDPVDEHGHRIPGDFRPM